MAYEIKVPSDLETTSILDVYVKVGDKIDTSTVLASLSADKADIDVISDVEGTVTSILVQKDQEVKAGDVLFVLQTESAAPAASIPEPIPTPAVAVAIEAPSTVVATIASPSPVVTDKGTLRSSPLAKEIAKAFGVDIQNIPASNGERVSKEDVINFVKQSSAVSNGATKSVTSGGGIAQRPLPDFTKFGSVERTPMSRINIATADNMNYAWSTIPHAWIEEKADITKIEAFRQQYKERVKQAGGALTMTAILAKACAAALHKFPIFNASIDLDKKEIIYKNFINIAIAVDTDRGLLVPVIRDADKKGLTEISIELTQISERTRNNQNKTDDFQGGTFTISNIGGIGCSSIMPIVASPQVAILGVTAAQQEAHLVDGAWQTKSMMPMTIGFDHRIINGADTARFLKYLKEMLEDPFLMQLY